MERIEKFLDHLFKLGIRPDKILIPKDFDEHEDEGAAHKNAPKMFM